MGKAPTFVDFVKRRGTDSLGDPTWNIYAVNAGGTEVWFGDRYTEQDADKEIERLKASEWYKPQGVR